MTIHDDDGLIAGSDPAGTIGPLAKKRRSKGVRVTYAAAVALGLAVGSGAIAGAATGGNTSTTTPSAPMVPGGPGWHSSFGGIPPAAVGTVATVGTDSFTITTRDNVTVTVTVTPSTTYLDPAVTSPTFATVKVGDHVAAFGTDTSNTVAATKVAIGPVGGPGGPGGPGGRHSSGRTPPTAVGTVASVGANTFTVTTSNKSTVTVTVTGSTTYRDPGVTSPSFTNLKAGDHVAVFGTDTDNTVAATQVCIGGSAVPPGPGGMGDPGDFGGPGGPGDGSPHAFGGTPMTGSSAGSTTSFGSAGSSLN